MQFTYTYLKNAADNNVMLGNWEGKKVYASSKEDLCESSASCAYVIYDDNNLLYYDGKIYGHVSASGNVDLCKVRAYNVRRAAPQVKEIPRAEAPQEATAAETTASGIVADVALEALVEDTLKEAREVSIDGLLKGFNYGLEP
jgi:exosome complex RNA-binding protein Rrp42 (RNase PH superfamily)